MKTWNNYKEYVKNSDSNAAKDLEEAEELSSIISAVIDKRTKLGLS